MEPVEPPATGWVFGDPEAYDPDDDLVAFGADLEPGTLLEAYRHGVFPMPVGRPRDPMAWWSPVRRGVLELDDLRVSRSLRRACRDVEIRIDTAFGAVVAACADPRRPGGWIDARITAAYTRLHELGWAHSVEAWRGERLVGGLYGLAIGGLFAGESMFHHERDASKVALVGLVEALRDGAPGAEGSDRSGAGRLVDVQWSTPHLESLGVREIDRSAYVARLAEVTRTPTPSAFASPH